MNLSDSCLKEITLAGLQCWQEWQLGDPWKAVPQGKTKVTWTREWW